MKNEQNKCDNCIHYHKETKRMGFCETNVIELFRAHLFDKDGNRKRFHITVKPSHYCGLHEKIKKAETPL